MKYRKFSTGAGRTGLCYRGVFWKWNSVLGMRMRNYTISSVDRNNKDNKAGIRNIYKNLYNRYSWNGTDKGTWD